MNGNPEEVIAFIFGLWMVLLNKYFAEAARQWGKVLSGVDSNLWFGRIGFILVGTVFMLAGLRKC
jgi:hypothetical protein